MKYEERILDKLEAMQADITEIKVDVSAIKEQVKGHEKRISENEAELKSLNRKAAMIGAGSGAFIAGIASAAKALFG